MKRKNTGFTIFETMIFLAVSGVLLVSALLLIGGQQNRTQFATAVRDIESRLRDVVNDVSTGVYNYNGNFGCSAPASGAPNISSIVTTEQGSNLGCTFIGRVFQFSPANDASRFYVYSVAGRQFMGTNPASGDVRTLWNAKPVAISPRTFDTTVPDATEKLELTNGLSVEKMTYNNGTGDVNIGSFGIFSNFNDTGSSTTVRQTADVWAIPNSALNESQETAAQRIFDMGTASEPFVIDFRNPANGVSICFVNGRVPQHGLITIGNQSGRLNTYLSIGSGSCP